MKTFEFALDPTGELGNITMPQMKGGRATVSEEVVQVQLGDPPVFEMSIPRSAIVRVSRVPDLTRATRGVHGWRGRWLVNRAGTGMVKITLNRRLPASMRAKPEGIPGLASAGRVANAVARLVLRERQLRINELTVSLEDPDGFIAVTG